MLTGKGDRVDTQEGAGLRRAPRGSGKCDARFVLAQQQWGMLLLTLLVVAIPALVLRFTPLERHPRPVILYDARISLASVAHDTIPAWVSGILPWGLLILTVLATELGVHRRRHSTRTDAATVALHFILSSVAAFGVVYTVTQATKVGVGELRPDFLDRCRPAAANGYAFQLAIGQGQEPAGLNCTGSAKAVAAGRVAFPSGHSSSSMVFAAFTALYTLWAAHFRLEAGSGPGRGGPSPGPGVVGPRRRWARDFLHALALYWALANLAVAWYIACSRVVDERHSTADVTAGMLLGGVVGAIFAARAIGSLGLLGPYDRGEEATYGQQRPLGEAQRPLGEVRDSASSSAVDRV